MKTTKILAILVLRSDPSSAVALLRRVEALLRRVVLVLALVLGLAAEVAKADFTLGTATNLGPTVNSSYDALGVCISHDDLSLYFCSDRPGGYGNYDLWITTRDTIDDEWGTPMNLGPNVNSQYSCMAPSISADGLALCFFSDRPGGRYGQNDLWQVSIEPVVDFNGDGIVDCADMCIMVDHWHTDEPSCDIGPMPWGDGIVDVQDLIVLAEYLKK